MAVYARQIESVLRQIKAKGESVIWRIPAVPTVADPAQPWIVTNGAAAVDNPVSIVFLPLNRQSSQLLQYLTGTEVVTGEVYGLMGAVAFTPELTATVVRTSGKVLGIKSIDPLEPNGEVILYTVVFKA